MATISKKSLLSLYESMLRQRLLEEEVVELFKQGLIPGLAHPYIGQEAVAAGVCAALGQGDLIVSNHRGHGHSLAKGVPERAILSELMGKVAVISTPVTPSLDLFLRLDNITNARYETVWGYGTLGFCVNVGFRFAR